MPRPLILLCLTLLTLIAFAANSVLGRLALAENDIGAWSYTLIRIVSGAMVLLCLAGVKRSVSNGSWIGAGSLLVYAVFFSFAYLILPTGTGALILFAAVQLTMLGWGFSQGERLNGLQWAGFILAVAGLVYLLSPGLEAPSAPGALLMTMSGIGWGAYSILGKGAGNPTARTSGNFFKACLILIVLSTPLLWALPEPLPTAKGWALAIASGAITSALGYALWYHVLKDISVTRAGIAQLTVPALAAFGGVIFVSEPLTFRFVTASVLILSGVAAATLTRSKALHKIN
ncbi:EamA domain-containing protein [Litorimonas haliclonae]